jgi:hypothetical protein
MYPMAALFGGNMKAWTYLVAISPTICEVALKIIYYTHTHTHISIYSYKIHQVTNRYVRIEIAQPVGALFGQPRFDSRQGKDFSFLHSIHTGCGAHPASCPVGTRCSFLGIKRQGREASVDVKNGGAIPPLRNMSPWLGA